MLSYAGRPMNCVCIYDYITASMLQKSHQFVIYTLIYPIYRLTLLAIILYEVYICFPCSFNLACLLCLLFLYEDLFINAFIFNC